MRYFFVAGLLALLLLPACVYFQKPLWRPDALVAVACARSQAVSMINVCVAQGYTGQAIAALAEGKNAQCQPSGSGQQCAMLLVYPEDRVFSYSDARRYTATVQAKTWFDMVVDGSGNVVQCRTETE